MMVPIAEVSECLTTLLATVGLGSGVSSHMPLNVLFINEALVANFALELLFGVRSVHCVNVPL